MLMYCNLLKIFCKSCYLLFTTAALYVGNNHSYFILYTIKISYPNKYYVLFRLQDIQDDTKKRSPLNLE